jgi:hypothetical protein
MEYEFDSAHEVKIAEILDRHAPNADEPMQVWTKVWSDPDYSDLDPALRLELDLLFTMELEEDFTSAGSVELVESNLRQSATRPLASTPAAAWRLRVALLSALTSEMLRAHVADLILTGKNDTTPAHSELTVNSYITCAVSGCGDAQHRAIALARANTIARQRHMALEVTVRREALRLARDLLGTKDEHAVLTLLAALAAPARDGSSAAGERVEVRRILLDLAAETMTFIDEIVRLLRISADSDSDRDDAARLHVNWYLNRARSNTDGIRKMHFAYEAMKLADRHGQLDLRNEAAVVLQGIGDDIELQSVTTEVRLSRNHFRSRLRRFRYSRDWRSAYGVFLAGRSPSGSHEQNLAEARSQSSRSILSSVTRMSLGPRNLPTHTGVDPVDEELHRIEQLTIGENSRNLALELAHINERFDSPTPDDFADWFGAVFGCDKVLAAPFADAQALHWKGDFAGASRICLPLIEAAARSLLLTLDEPLYRAERGASPGRFPAMDFYVQSLETNGMDIDWVRALRVTLLSDGLNLRNLYAHGFKFEFSEIESALLLRLVGLLCALAGTTDSAELSRPTAPAQRGLRRRLGWVWV